MAHTDSPITLDLAWRAGCLNHDMRQWSSRMLHEINSLILEGDEAITASNILIAQVERIMNRRI